MAILELYETPICKGLTGTKRTPDLYGEVAMPGNWYRVRIAVASNNPAWDALMYCGHGNRMRFTYLHGGDPDVGGFVYLHIIKRIDV